MNNLSAGSRWRAFAAISLGVLVTTIDASIVNIALPAIGHDFHVDLSAVSWVNLAYLLGVTGTLLSLGRLADLIGRRRIYVSGFALFTLAALLCGLAPSLYVLIAFRTLQAIGASMMFANALAILSTCFPPNQRGKAFGLAAAFASAGVGIGPSLGGGLVSALSWRWVFWSYTPIALIGSLVAWRGLPKDAPGQRDESFDVPGTLLSFVFMTSLVLSLKFLPGGSPVVGSLFVLLALSGGFALVVHERKIKSPLVSPVFVTDPVLRTSTIDAFMGYLALYIYVLLLPFFLIDYAGHSAALTGLILTAEPAVSIFTGPLGGRLSDRFGSRKLVLTGLGITAIGLWALSDLSLDSTAWDAIWRVALIGLGFGLFYTPNNSALIGAAPANQLGVATGIASVASNLGMAGGVALGSAVIAGMTGGASGAGQGFVMGFGVAMRVASMICLGAMLIGARWTQAGTARPASGGPSHDMLSLAGRDQD